MTDTADPSHITDHAFEPKDEWWMTCRICNLGEAAHERTSVVHETTPSSPPPEGDVGG